MPWLWSVAACKGRQNAAFSVEEAQTCAVPLREGGHFNSLEP